MKRARELKIIELTGSKKRSEYKFTNKLSHLYFF